MSTTEARPARRAQILETAAALFAARGFHGVSVADIGASCGVSGPALYKHFASKDALLAEMLVSVSARLLDLGRDRVAAARGPAEALHALVEAQVDFALDHRDLIVVQDRDWESLPDGARARVRALQRAYVELWAEACRALDGTLTPAAARARAHAVFGLINSTPHSARVPEPEMTALLSAMAARALELPPLV